MASNRETSTKNGSWKHISVSSKTLPPGSPRLNINTRFRVSHKPKNSRKSWNTRRPRLWMSNHGSLHRFIKFYILCPTRRWAHSPSCHILYLASCFVPCLIFFWIYILLCIFSYELNFGRENLNYKWALSKKKNRSLWRARNHCQIAPTSQC